jgi:hypothetical protein
MEYIAIDFESRKRTPKYKLRVLMSKTDVYVYPEVLGLTEVLAVLYYCNDTLSHKKHIYVALDAIMNSEKPLESKLYFEARKLYLAITSSEPYDNAMNQLYNII